MYVISGEKPRSSSRPREPGTRCEPNLIVVFVNKPSYGASAVHISICKAGFQQPYPQMVERYHDIYCAISGEGMFRLKSYLIRCLGSLHPA